MGYLSFDEAVGEACATKIEEVVPGASCATLPADLGPFLGDMAICQGLITPLQGKGEDPCGITIGEGYEQLPGGCIDDLVCVGAADVMPTCEQGVSTAGDCSAEGAQCGGDDGCVDGICTEQLDEGEVCRTGPECSSENCGEGVCGAPSPLCPP